MIRLDLSDLDLSDIETEFVPVAYKRMRKSTPEKLSKVLRKFECPQHIQIGEDNSVDIIGMFGPENRVQDVDRYRVIVSDGVCDVKKHSQFQIAPTKNKHCDLQPNHGKSQCTIVLLLESPHKDEYENGDPNFPIAPAQGATGRNIEKYLGCSLNKSEEMADEIGDNARFIIANPVQFQTSLWTIHKGSLTAGHCWQTLRNAVWKTLWNEPQIQDEFRCRLQSYKPNIVLNCCTGGEKGLRGQVQSVLFKFNSGAQLYKADHPASWKKGVKFSKVSG